MQEQKHFSGAKYSKGLAPITKGFAKANLGGAVFDYLAYSGGVVIINGTAVMTLYRKQRTTVYNATEAKLDAAAKLSDLVFWLRIYMEDMSLPYHTPVPIGEDNSAAQIIDHAGKMFVIYPLRCKLFRNTFTIMVKYLSTMCLLLTIMQTTSQKLYPLLPIVPIA